MQIQLYPNRELRVVWGCGRPPSIADGNEKLREQRSPLVIRSQPSQPRREGGLRRHPLTKKAKHKILQYGGLFRDERKECQVLLLGTLPGSTDESIREMVRLAPYVGKAVQTYLPRHAGVPARRLKYLWVWELQGRGALHMHMVCECDTPEDARKLFAGWRSCWIQAMRAAQKKANCDLFERKQGGTHAGSDEKWICSPEMVETSAARYLSKYQSKGSEGDPELYPPRWWGVSSAMRREYVEFCGKNRRAGNFRPKKDTPVYAPRVLIQSWLERFTGRFATSKQSHADTTSVDCFSYVEDGNTIEEAWKSLVMFCRKFNLMDEVKEMGERARYLRDIVSELRFIANDQMWPDMRVSLAGMMSADVYERVMHGNEYTAEDIKEFGHCFGTVSYLRGYDNNYQPWWCRRLKRIIAVGGTHPGNKAAR